LAFMGEENSKMNMIFAKDRISRWIIDDFIDSKFLKLTEILIFKFLDFNYKLYFVIAYINNLF
jgi:hypothetical protein